MRSSFLYLVKQIDVYYCTSLASPKSVTQTGTPKVGASAPYSKPSEAPSPANRISTQIPSLRNNLLESGSLRAQSFFSDSQFWLLPLLPYSWPFSTFLKSSHPHQITVRVLNFCYVPIAHHTSSARRMVTQTVFDSNSKWISTPRHQWLRIKFKIGANK